MFGTNKTQNSHILEKLFSKIPSPPKQNRNNLEQKICDQQNQSVKGSDLHYPECNFVFFRQQKIKYFRKSWDKACRETGTYRLFHI